MATFAQDEPNASETELLRRFDFSAYFSTIVSLDDESINISNHETRIQLIEIEIKYTIHTRPSSQVSRRHIINIILVGFVLTHPFNVKNLLSYPYFRAKISSYFFINTCVREYLSNLLIVFS